MIGLVQCLAMIPGVSRSGATILGAMSFGVDRKTAAEFSFFLAVAPVRVGTARKKLKSAAVLRSTPIATAPMIVAPDRLTPGMIARH